MGEGGRFDVGTAWCIDEVHDPLMGGSISERAAPMTWLLVKLCGLKLILRKDGCGDPGYR